MKIITYYCKLCCNYGIKYRITHLIDYHAAKPKTSKHATHYKSIIEFLFQECVQNKFDLPPPPKLMTYPRMDRMKTN